MKKSTKMKLKAGLMSFALALGLLGFGALAASCKSPTDTPDTVCACPDKDHLGIGEKCCNGTDCTCELKVYGTIIDNSGNVIPIYRNGNVTDTQMATATENAIQAYSDLTIYHKMQGDGKLKELHIVPEGEYGCDSVGNGQYVLKMGCNLDSNSMRLTFVHYIDNFFVQLQQRKINMIKPGNATVSVT